MANEGMLMIAGLGALLFLGLGKKKPAEDVEDTDLGSVAFPPDASPVIVVPLRGQDLTQIGGFGGKMATKTELAVRRSEQIKKQGFSASVTTAPSVLKGDIDAVAISKGTFKYGGARRPTRSAIPVWNNKYGWYWADPNTGLPVGPGGKTWPSVNMGSSGTNIGQRLPDGWTPSGGSAYFTADPWDD